MAEQPANSTIAINRTIRAYRSIGRHDSVAAIIWKLRPLVMSIPGEEILSKVLTRDTSVSDMSPYMGEARHGASRGFPIVFGQTDPDTFASAETGITGVDFAVRVGSDAFLQHASGYLDRDLHKDARDLS